MNTFGGRALRLDRNDINTDEIIPAKYLTEISKVNLKPHVLEDLVIEGQRFAGIIDEGGEIGVVISRRNFGCGSSREHAVWAFEVNGINLIIAESFARIFRQNMFNCGILAIELDSASLEDIFKLEEPLEIFATLEENSLTVVAGPDRNVRKTYSFALNDFDRELVSAGGWLAYAGKNY